MNKRPERIPRWTSLVVGCAALTAVSLATGAAAQEAAPSDPAEVASAPEAPFDLPTTRQMVTGHFALAALFQENGNIDGATIEYESIAGLLAPHFEDFTENDATAMAQALLALSEFYRPRSIEAAEQVAAENLGLILQWAGSDDQGVWIRLHAAQTARAAIILLLKEEFDQAGEVAAEALRSIGAIEEAGVRVPERLKAQAMSAFSVGVLNASNPEIATDTYERLRSLLEPVDADLDMVLNNAASVFAAARVIGADSQGAIEAVEQNCADYAREPRLVETLAEYRVSAEVERICGS